MISSQWPHGNLVRKVIMFTLKHFILFTKPPNALKDQLSLKDQLARAGKGFGFLWFKHQSWNTTKLNYYQIIRVWLILCPSSGGRWILTGLLPIADNTLEGVIGGVEGINIPEGSVCIISMQLPEYPQSIPKK